MCGGPYRIVFSRLRLVISQHLKVLRVVGGWRVCVGLLEGVHHADAFNGLLLDAVYFFRRRNSSRFQNRWHNIDDVMELVTDSALIVNMTRPGNRHALARSAKVRSNLLGPREWSIKCPRP